MVTMETTHLQLDIQITYYGNIFTSVVLVRQKWLLLVIVIVFLGFKTFSLVIV